MDYVGQKSDKDPRGIRPEVPAPAAGSRGRERPLGERLSGREVLEMPVDIFRSCYGRIHGVVLCVVGQ